MTNQNPLTRVQAFVDHLEFTEYDIQDYSREFNIPIQTMRQMATRITRELKADLEKVLQES